MVGTIQVVISWIYHIFVEMRANLWQRSLNSTIYGAEIREVMCIRDTELTDCISAPLLTLVTSTRGWFNCGLVRIFTPSFTSWIFWSLTYSYSSSHSLILYLTVCFILFVESLFLESSALVCNLNLILDHQSTIHSHTVVKLCCLNKNLKQ